MTKNSCFCAILRDVLKSLIVVTADRCGKREASLDDDMKKCTLWSLRKRLLATVSNGDGSWSGASGAERDAGKKQLRGSRGRNRVWVILIMVQFLPAVIPCQLMKGTYVSPLGFSISEVVYFLFVITYT